MPAASWPTVASRSARRVLLLEPAQLGEVLEVDTRPITWSLHVAQRRHGDADRQLDRRRSVIVRSARRSSPLAPTEQRGQAGQQRVDRLPDHRARQAAQDLAGGLVRGEHGAVRRDRDQARGERAHDVLVQRDRSAAALRVVASVSAPFCS